MNQLIIELIHQFPTYQGMDGKSLQNIWVSRECRPWATADDDDDNDNDNSPSPSPSALL